MDVITTGAPLLAGGTTAAGMGEEVGFREVMAEAEAVEVETGEAAAAEAVVVKGGVDGVWGVLILV